MANKVTDLKGRFSDAHWDDVAEAAHYLGCGVGDFIVAASVMAARSMTRDGVAVRRTVSDKLLTIAGEIPPVE